ncbi:UNVERIFIED_CONTAM: Malonyl-coenzyme:anthocyanin 5-O-glucoside-6'''-O-malonyltransferase, partial [Sesamum latifolium]
PDTDPQPPWLQFLNALKSHRRPGRSSLSRLYFLIWYGMGSQQIKVFYSLSSLARNPISWKPLFLTSKVPSPSLSANFSHLPETSFILSNLEISSSCVMKLGIQFLLQFLSPPLISITVGNDPRVCDEFYAFAPHLPPATYSENSTSCPVLALQVTLFPGQGLCIGFVTHHAVADASTVVSFMQAWALINKNKPNGTDKIRDLLTEGNLLQFYDRKAVTNINGLDDIYWDVIVDCSCPAEPPSVELPINKLRTTFVLKKEDIQRLKNFVSAKCPNIGHLSSFTIICALVWVCSAKSAAAGGEDVPDDEPEYFGFVADCRGRLNPPLPANYFGNCVALVMAELKHGEVKGNDGFVRAAKAIGEAIKENVYSEKGVLYGAEKWPDEYGQLVGKRQYGVAGSPRFDFYAVDYGWGKPKKFEALFIDGGGSISLCKSRDFEGGLEIGLSKPKVQMDAFTAVFKEILESSLP